MSFGNDRTSAIAGFSLSIKLYKMSISHDTSLLAQRTQKELLGKLICIIVLFQANPGLIKLLIKLFPHLSCCPVTVLN